MELKNILGTDEICLGIDTGSTTIKLALFKNNELVYFCYERHLSLIKQKFQEKLEGIRDIIGTNKMKLAI